MTTISPDPLAVVTERLDHLRTWLEDEGLVDVWHVGGHARQVVISPGEGTRYAFAVVPPMLATTTDTDHRELSRHEGLLVGLAGTGGWGPAGFVAHVSGEYPPSLFDVRQAIGRPDDAGDRYVNPFALALTFAVWSFLVGEPVDTTAHAIAGFDDGGMTGPAILARWKTFGG